jgi:hypothetical protein
MTFEEQAELEALCQQIVTEKDHQKFTALVHQLNTLLSRKERRLEGPSDSLPPTP